MRGNKMRRKFKLRYAVMVRARGYRTIRTLKTRSQGASSNCVKFKRNDFESAISVYNVLNSGANIQYKSPGGNQMYSPNFLQAFNKLPARGFQIQFVDKF